MNPHLKFDISPLMEASVGTKETYSFEAPLDYHDVKTRSYAKGQVELMRLEEGINVRLLDVELDIELDCVRTLKPFTYHVLIENTDRIFYFDVPKELHDPNDLFLIDKKRLKIDITEFLRQEIILHFPAIPVDYQGSTALLDKYSKEEELENKPLAGLKDLLK